MPRGRVRVLGAGWQVSELPIGTGRRGSGVGDAFVERLLQRGQWEAVHAADISAGERRGAETTAVEIEADVEPGVAYAMAARHASGAITFHFAIESERRGRGGGGSRRVRFQIPISQETGAGERRGILGKVVRTVLLKFAGKIADKTVPALGLAFEKLEWKHKGLKEGLKVVSAQELAAPKPKLARVAEAGAFSTDPSHANLLLLHGTFSDAGGAFRGLATTRAGGATFFDLVKPLYGDRIFALDHFTVSRTPEENAKAVLDALPAGPCVFDAITHSRGGLVLRDLVELQKSPKFKLRRAVLVASPNAGTPLASPKRFDVFVTWISNLLDLFPDNPFTTGVEFVSEGLGWIAHHIVGALPGLAAMDSAGTDIANLEHSGYAPAEAYSALAANFEPDRNLLARLADAGVDVFFGSANDLVVPSEGGWRKAPGAAPLIPGDRIGCFGRGGNLQGQVTHIGFFDKPETVTFLATALGGAMQPIATLDPNQDLPFLLRRGAALETGAGASAVLPAAAAPAAATKPPTEVAAAQPAPAGRGPAAQGAPSGPGATGDDVFYLSVLAPKTADAPAMLVANFRNASAMEIMYRGGKDIHLEDDGTSGGAAARGPAKRAARNPQDQKALDAGQRWKRIIGIQRDIQGYVNGDPKVKKLPDSKALIQLGGELFEVLFPGEIRRLYDGARAVQPNGRLNLVFTSQVSWMADLPWEFVYDPNRKTFLAVSEVNFTRNVLTAIPAERGDALDRKLRILVIVAQPLGMAHLSVDEETAVIKSGFSRLTEAGIADVEVLLDATPALLHRTLETMDYDIVHFIGHGSYDAESDLGYLFFESEDGRELTRVDSDVLRQIICRRGIRLLVLNACETGRGGIADFNRGVAPALVAGGVPAVIANQYSVLDVSATAFARHFYWALGQGQTLGDAAREARVSVNYSISGEAIDWAVPVVFARNPAERITVEKQPVRVDREMAAGARRGVRRSGRRIQVALWDVQRMIPGLEEIAGTLNRAQERFEFRVVSLTAPLGTWRVEKDDGKGKGKAYLIAEHVVERLGDKPREFGVDRLIAVTNLPLRSSNKSDLQVWEDPDAKIAILSIYGFLEMLAPPRLTIEHLITNIVTASLCSLTNHKSGAKTCLMYENPPADPSIAGRLLLCGVCKRRLQKKPEEITWIEAMLAAYA